MVTTRPRPRRGGADRGRIAGATWVITLVPRLRRSGGLHARGGDFPVARAGAADYDQGDGRRPRLRLLQDRRRRHPRGRRAAYRHDGGLPRPQPAAPTHVLVVPVDHHDERRRATAAASPATLAELVATAAAVAEDEGLGDSYRLVFNTGAGRRSDRLPHPPAPARRAPDDLAAGMRRLAVAARRGRAGPHRAAVRQTRTTTARRPGPPRRRRPRRTRPATRPPTTPPATRATSWPPRPRPRCRPSRCATASGGSRSRCRRPTRRRRPTASAPTTTGASSSTPSWSRTPTSPAPTSCPATRPWCTT